jgi:OPA family glycerol-3-phosphate transporter-like MFS transporter
VSPVLPARTIWVLWLTYGSFYFCRTNISAAVPGIKAELGFSNAEMGLVLGGLKLAYGLGQLVNGQLAERVSPRKMLAVGMFGSAACNVVFGLGAGLSFLLFVWACNGYMQALGWTPTMRVAADWLAPDVRGRAIGIIGTSYQVTAALTYVIAGFAAEAWGWRGALWIPAGLLVLAGVHMLVLLQEKPPREVDAQAAAGVARSEPERLPLRRTIGATLANPALWFLALSLGLLNANRYGFVDWGVTHVAEMSGGGIGEAALEYAVLPAGGILGVLASGWASDRFLGGRRAPVIVVMLVLLATLTLAYGVAVQHGIAWTVVCLFGVGFVLFGAQVLLVGTAPVDLARPGTQAAAVGFVNFMGYMGAYAGDVVTGGLADRYGWDAAVDGWAIYAALAAVCAAVLWNRRG